MKTCLICKENLSADVLSVCRDCIITNFTEAKPYIDKAHKKSREDFSMVIQPPKFKEGKECKICINKCKIPPTSKNTQELGFCMIRYYENKRLKSYPLLEYYYDSLPTNCVASFVCPGCSNHGYPKYSYAIGPEYNYKNLAVFYASCSFNCLFCQNWHYRYILKRKTKDYYITEEELAEAVKEDTSCICYFGGDPTPSLAHAIRTSRYALNKNKHRILRICFETNGSMNPKFLPHIAELTLRSGGCIKFDLKAYNNNLHYALTGVSNEYTLSNFKYLSQYISKRKEVYFLIASTLLVPYYITQDEVYKIAKFIKSCNPEIPYSLLAFYPQFYMQDLPITTKKEALSCFEAAKAAGLKNVHLGNIHLLTS